MTGTSHYSSVRMKIHIRVIFEYRPSCKIKYDNLCFFFAQFGQICVSAQGSRTDVDFA